MYSESNFELDSAILHTDGVDDIDSQNPAARNARPSGLTQDPNRMQA